MNSISGESVKKHGNRIHQTPAGVWYFKFKFDGVSYFKTNFDTQEQAEQALQLQYKVLNLTTSGQKRKKEVFIERK